MPGGAPQNGGQHRGKQTWTTRAEDLQIHLEQRVLKDNKLLESARQGYKAHVRAYMTHVREERKYFDSAQLHKGHLAKSFGLRETPGGAGGASGKSSGPAAGQKTNKRKAASSSKSQAGHDDDLSAVQIDVDEAAKRMRAKLAAMGAADEFNIG